MLWMRSPTTTVVGVDDYCTTTLKYRIRCLRSSDYSRGFYVSSRELLKGPAYSLFSLNLWLTSSKYLVLLLGWEDREFEQNQHREKLKSKELLKWERQQEIWAGLTLFYLELSPTNRHRNEIPLSHSIFYVARLVPGHLSHLITQVFHLHFVVLDLLNTNNIAISACASRRDL